MTTHVGHHKCIRIVAIFVAEGRLPAAINYNFWADITCEILILSASLISFQKIDIISINVAKKRSQNSLKINFNRPGSPPERVDILQHIEQQLKDCCGKPKIRGPSSALL